MNVVLFINCVVSQLCCVDVAWRVEKEQQHTTYVTLALEIKNITQKYDYFPFLTFLRKYPSFLHPQHTTTTVTQHSKMFSVSSKLPPVSPTHFYKSKHQHIKREIERLEEMDIEYMITWIFPFDWIDGYYQTDSFHVVPPGMRKVREKRFFTILRSFFGFFCFVLSIKKCFLFLS